jgi:phosphoglycerate dehydrogenase-like enzyme
MESINVVVTGTISDERQQKIISVSPRIKLTDVSDLIRAEQSGNLTFKEKLDGLLAEAEVILWSPLAHPQNLITRAPKLKWVQAVVVGVASLLDAEMVASPVILTNARGIPSTAMSEFVLELMLMFVKQAPLCFQLKQEKQWRQFRPTVLRSKTVGIIGLGSIGRKVARLAKAFSMRVLAIDVKRIARARYVDIMLPPGQLQQLLVESDFVVLSLPLTPETSKLIGEEELRTMKSTAYLINVARGRIVDEEALIRALDEHWIAGAGLDVFATEPLPTDSRLWELPNVIFSPHISSGFEDADIRVSDLFSENLRRYLNGKKLLNVVNKKRGY